VEFANNLQKVRKKFGNMRNLYRKLFCHDNLLGFNNSPEVIHILLNDGTCMNIRCSRAPPRSLQEEELLNENLGFIVKSVKTNVEALEN
jgi:hypothetical protein